MSIRSFNAVLAKAREEILAEHAANQTYPIEDVAIPETRRTGFALVDKARKLEADKIKFKSASLIAAERDFEGAIFDIYGNFMEAMQDLDNVVYQFDEEMHKSRNRDGFDRNTDLPMIEACEDLMKTIQAAASRCIKERDLDGLRDAFNTADKLLVMVRK